MAAKRVTKFTLDWQALGNVLTKHNQPKYQAFKAKSEAYLTKVLSLPSEPPKIDWEYYKRILPVDFVSQLEKSYKSYVVPYPKENLKSSIDAQEKELIEISKKVINESNERVRSNEEQLFKWKDIIPIEKLHLEEIHDSFPDHVINVWEKPTFYPHDYEFDPHPRHVPGLHPGGGASH